MATMKFDGVEREIPRKSRWLSQDDTGQWYAHTHKPVPYYEWREWLHDGYDPTVHKDYHICAGNPPADWTQELYRLVWS